MKKEAFSIKAKTFLDSPKPIKDFGDFENYPAWMIVVSNLLNVLICVIGALIIYKIGLVWMILYLIYILVLEFRLIRWHCIDCYYYGKACAFGRGKICSLFFSKGNNRNFCKREMTWKSLIPEFLVSLVPILIGIILLIKNFNWFVLLLVIILFILTSFGNGFVRGNIACKYCKQRKLGCPAQKIFKSKMS
jgi:hypothetical protein